ncbi:MAG: hypothetical protein WCD53_25620 [Microcoleus sp.]
MHLFLGALMRSRPRGLYFSDLHDRFCRGSIDLKSSSRGMGLWEIRLLQPFGSSLKNWELGIGNWELGIRNSELGRKALGRKALGIGNG